MSNNNQYRTCVAAILAYDEWQKNSLLSHALFPDKIKNKRVPSRDEETFCASILDTFNGTLAEADKNTAIIAAISNKYNELNKNRKAANPYFLALLRNLNKYIHNREQKSDLIKVVTKKNYHTPKGLALLLKQRELSIKSADIVRELEIAKTKAKLSSSNNDAINRTLSKLLKPLKKLPLKVEVNPGENIKAEAKLNKDIKAESENINKRNTNHNHEGFNSSYFDYDSEGDSKFNDNLSDIESDDDLNLGHAETETSFIQQNGDTLQSFDLAAVSSKNEDSESEDDSMLSNTEQEIPSVQQNNNIPQPLQLEAHSLEEVSQIIKRSIKHIEFLAKENKKLLACVQTANIQNSLLPPTLNVQNQGFTNKITACLQHINDYLAEIDKRRTGTNTIKKEFALTIRARLVELLASERLNEYQTATELCAEIEYIINESQLRMTNPENIGIFYKKQCGQMLAKLSQELVVQEEVDTFVSNLFNDLDKPVSELAGMKQQAKESRSLIKVWQYYQYLALYLDGKNMNSKNAKLKQEIQDPIFEIFRSDYTNYFDIINTFFETKNDYDERADNNEILAQLAILATIDKNENGLFNEFIQKNYLGDWINAHFNYLITQEKPNIFAATTCLQLLEQFEHMMSHTKISHHSESSINLFKLIRTKSLPVTNTAKFANKKSVSDGDADDIKYPFVRTNTDGNNIDLLALLQQDDLKKLEKEIPLHENQAHLNKEEISSSKQPAPFKHSTHIKNGYGLTLIALRDKLKARLSSPIKHGYGNLESIYAASITNSLNGHTLHILQTLPDNLHDYHGSCILTNNKLYYISCSGGIEPLTLTKFKRFKKKIDRVNPDNLDKIILSDGEFEDLIEKSLKDDANKKYLQSLKQTTLQAIIQKQVRDDVSGAAYSCFVSPQFERFNPESSEKRICEKRLNQKLENELNTNFYLTVSTRSDANTFIKETAKTYDDTTEYTGPFFEYVREKISASGTQIVENKKSAEVQNDQEALRLARRYAIIAAYNDLKLNAQESKIQLHQYFNKKDITLLLKLRNFSLDKALFDITKPLLQAPSSNEPNSPQRQNYEPLGVFMSPEGFEPSPNRQGQPDVPQAATLMDSEQLRIIAIKKDEEFEKNWKKLYKSNPTFKKKFKQYYNEAKTLPRESVDLKYTHASKEAGLWMEITKNQKELKALRSFLQTILALFSAKQRQKIADKTDTLRSKYAQFFKYKKMEKLEMQVHVNHVLSAYKR